MTLDLRYILSAQGPVARRLGAKYEARPQQVRMAEAVSDVLRQPGQLMVEAGTGVGKSFAYLLPAIDWILSHRAGGAGAFDGDSVDGSTPEGRGSSGGGGTSEGRGSSGGGGTSGGGGGGRRRVVISTHTIALQEQIMNKDLPLLRAVLPDEFSAVLVKGRGNYVSLRRLSRAWDRKAKLFGDDDEQRSLQILNDWARETDDGSLATRPTLPKPSVWEYAQSDAEDCMGRACPRYRDCFYQSDRRRAEHADLLVVNHALFFSDLALRAGGASILPDYDHVILDEAHTLEDVASDHFGLSLSRFAVMHLLGRLASPRRQKGLLYSLSSDVDRHMVNRAIQAVSDARYAGEDFFKELEAWHQQFGRRNGRVDKPGIIENALTGMFQDLVTSLRVMRDRVTDAQQRRELDGYINRAQTIATTLTAWLDQTIPDSVYWLDVSRRGRLLKVRMQAAPIDVAPLMRKHLFEASNSRGDPVAVVMTSATLATDARRGRSKTAASRAPRGHAQLHDAASSGDQASQADRIATPALDERVEAFDHLRRRLGCTEASTLWLDSPFDYANQVRLLIEDDLPEPGDRRYLNLMLPRLIEHLDRTDGGAFVLFTGYEALREIASQLQAPLRQRDMPLLVQGEELPRSELLRLFRENRRSVLLGADSFWQGVDVQGEGLRQVLIVRLPFAVPDRPLIEARSEMLRKQGKSPFMELSLPDAILKFKQGFGRLVRSRQDTGEVVVFDSRLVKKPYGRRFIAALPDIPVHRRSDRSGEHDTGW